MCLSLILNDLRIPQAKDAKYLGLHLDRKLNWKKHIFIKRKQLGLQLEKMYWLLGNKSQLSTQKKIVIVQGNFQTYLGLRYIQLWGMASNSNIEIL